MVVKQTTTQAEDEQETQTTDADTTTHVDHTYYAPLSVGEVADHTPAYKRVFRKYLLVLSFGITVGIGNLLGYSVPILTNAILGGIFTFMLMELLFGMYDSSTSYYTRIWG